MSFYAKMRCCGCRGIFDIYQEQMNHEKHASCPYCGIQIPEEQWAGLVDCFHSVANWNENARNSSAEHGTPLFAAEIRRHFVNRHRSEV